MSTVEIRIAAAFTVGAVAGGATAYYFTKKHYRAIADQEVADVKAQYSEPKPSDEAIIQQNIKIDTSDLRESLKLSKEEIEERLNSSYEAKLEHLGYADKADLETEGLPSDHDLLDPAERAEAEANEIEDDPALWERDFEKPYVINVDEWNTEHVDNPEWDKISLTYYDGDTDDVLTPEDGQPLTDLEYVVGLANLNHFGVGSKDKDIVYVRNEDMTTDFEITRANGSYAQLALGISEWNNDEDAKPKVKKMRGDGS